MLFTLMFIVKERYAEKDNEIGIIIPNGVVDSCKWDIYKQKEI